MTCGRDVTPPVMSNHAILIVFINPIFAVMILMMIKCWRNDEVTKVRYLPHTTIPYYYTRHLPRLACHIHILPFTAFCPPSPHATPAAALPRTPACDAPHDRLPPTYHCPLPVTHQPTLPRTYHLPSFLAGRCFHTLAPADCNLTTFVVSCLVFLNVVYVRTDSIPTNRTTT